MMIAREEEMKRVGRWHDLEFRDNWWEVGFIAIRLPVVADSNTLPWFGRASAARIMMLEMMMTNLLRPLKTYN